MKYEINQGRIIVNDVRHVIDAENFHVFEVDLRSKYPGPVDWEFEDDCIKVWVAPNPEETLKWDHAAVDDTFIAFHIPDMDYMKWNVVSEARRYTWRIILWKRPVD